MTASAAAISHARPVSLAITVANHFKVAPFGRSVCFIAYKARTARPKGTVQSGPSVSVLAVLLLAQRFVGGSDHSGWRSQPPAPPYG